MEENMGYQTNTRISRVGFPRFFGEDFEVWGLGLRNFYVVDRTLEDAKVNLDSIHFEGEAFEWHQVYVRKHGVVVAQWKNILMLWPVDLELMLFNDPMAEVMNL